MIARTLRTQKELHKKNNKELLSILKEEGFDFEDQTQEHRLGRCIIKDQSENWTKVAAPDFVKDREFIFSNISQENDLL
jgi:hypothetical protein